MVDFLRRFFSRSTSEQDFDESDESETHTNFPNRTKKISAEYKETDITVWDKIVASAKAVFYYIIAGLLAVAVAFIIFITGIKEGIGQAKLQPPPRMYEAGMDWTSLPKWTNAADPIFLQDTINNAEKFESNAFDQFALGLHERDNGSIVRAYYYLTFAAARAHPYARTMRDKLDLSDQEKTTARNRFEQSLFFGGKDANFLLGMLYLNDTAFALAREPNTIRCGYTTPQVEPTWPPCETNFALPGAARLAWPNNLLGANTNEAYLSFARATQCFHPEAPLWLTAMEKAGLVDQTTAQFLRAQASNQAQNGGEREEFCNGGVWIGQASGVGNGRDYANARFERFGDAYCSLDENEGLSRAQRDRPGRSGYGPADDPTEAPLCAPEDTRDPYCDEAAAALEAADEARVCLRMGDAMLAAGDVDLALKFFRAAIAQGRKYGAQASVVAGDRLRALSLTCEYTTASLAQISRGSIGSNFINVVDRQRALKALGHYRSTVDGKYGRGTREAVRIFQRGIGFDETGVMSPLETVILICQAAENKGDADAQNLLGLMYAAGLGVVQSTDLALQWLDTAAQRGSVDASYNLAILYATGTILSSYRLCDRRFNDEVARGYYDDARQRGHPRATRESFAQFKARVVTETNTGLEIVTPSCGAPQKDAGDGQNK